MADRMMDGWYLHINGNVIVEIARMKSRGMYTIGDIAAASIADEGLLYDLFGINAELLIGHAGVLSRQK